MTNGIDIYTLIFAALALFLVFKLRATLGSKTGEEKPFNDYSPPQQESTASKEAVILPFPQNAQEKPFKWQGFAEPSSPRATTFDAIAAIDPSFMPQDFINGAKNAYELFTQAFARNDRATLQPHLSPEVFESFNDVMKARELAKERVDFRFVSLDKVEINDVSQTAKEAEITLLFIAQVISATYDKDGKLLDGAPDRVVEMRDLWTFAKDLTTKNPNWTLVGTDDVE